MGVEQFLRRELPEHTRDYFRWQRMRKLAATKPTLKVAPVQDSTVAGGSSSTAATPSAAMATVAAAGEPESACLSDDGSIVVDADGDDDEDDDSNHAAAAEDLSTQRASDAGGSASIDDVSPVFQVRANAMHGRSVTTRASPCVLVCAVPPGCNESTHGVHGHPGVQRVCRVRVHVIPSPSPSSGGIHSPANLSCRHHHHTGAAA